MRNIAWSIKKIQFGSIAYIFKNNKLHYYYCNVPAAADAAAVFLCTAFSSSQIKTKQRAGQIKTNILNNLTWV